MSIVQIKRRRNTKIDPKQVLRAHVDHLPPEKQREFIAAALQLIATRTGTNKAESGPDRYMLARTDVRR